MNSEDVFYTKNHDWIRWDSGSRTAYLGLTSNALDEIGDISFIDFKKYKGDTFKKNDVLFIIESTKIIFEVVALLSGKVLRKNINLKGKTISLSYKTWIIEFFISEVNPKSFLKSHFMSESYYLNYLKTI